MIRYPASKKTHCLGELILPQWRQIGVVRRMLIHRRIVGGEIREFFLVIPLKKDQEAEGHETQGDVVMQPLPRPALEVIQPELLLELLVPLLDCPAAMRQGHQPGDGSILGEVGDVVFIAVLADCGTSVKTNTVHLSCFP